MSYLAMRLWIATWILLAIAYSDAASDCDLTVTGNSTSTNGCKLEPVKKCRFDSKLGAKKCKTFFKREKRQTSIVGVPCQENIDCQTTDGGAYCDATKRCACLPAYVNINGFCWAKRNPGESCQYNDQCTSVSPNAYCDSSSICRCSNNQPPVITYDGLACILPGECPTNGINSKLRHPTTGADVECGGEKTGPKDCVVPADGQIGTEAAPFTYSCMCANPLLQAGSVDYLCNHENSGPSYCCPVRAIACIQPREEGVFSGGSPQQRYWYNSASGSCEPLNYRGSGGNGNNFQTKSLCESYCKTSCLRGSPMMNLNPGQSAEVIPPTPVVCSQTVQCSQNFECHTRGVTTTSICCPSKDFICGPQGGIEHPDVVAPDVGDASFGVRNAVIRYYYNKGDRRCQQFTYRGYGGSYNNFHTEAECRTFCAQTLCANGGEPLRDSSGTVVVCGAGGSSVCPGKYDCTTGGVCCPSTNFICGQPMAIGACGNYAERWWYNSATRSCEKFFYSGCQGNSNNFNTYQECLSQCSTSDAKPVCPQGEAAKESNNINYIVCSGASTTVTNCPADYYCHFDGTRYGCCPTRSKTCSVDALDQGTPCVTPVTRWYYNSQTKTCSTFSYNGCDGNSNNFATKIDCQDYCGVGGCPEGGEPFRDTFTGQYRVCGTSGSECPNGFTCSIVTLGTSNRFNYCCPTRSFVCSLGQDQGQQCGTATLNRYFFNPTTRTCEMFTYNGCGGNRNNFASMQQCLTYCNSAGCPAGQVAMQDTTNKQLITCNVQSPGSCATGYSCTMSSLLQQGICCGSNAPPGACPGGQTAHMDSFTSSPLQCQPNVDNSCPNGIFCQYSFALQNSFCCSTTTVQCPQGGTPLLDTLSNQPRQCTPGVTDACPFNYQCQATTVIVGTVPSATGYCCGSSNICGNGFTPYYVNNQAVPCVVNAFPSVCPTPSTCRQTLNGQSYCCSPSNQPVLQVCGVNKQPYVVSGAPMLCTQTSVNTRCPAGYTCDLYQQTGSYYCCRFGNVPPPTPTSSCPPSYVLIQPIQTCTPGGISGSCPQNAICNWDQSNQRYACCMSNNIPIPPSPSPCPNNAQVYINPSTNQAQICALGGGNTGCPTNYGCQYSSSMRNYYCCRTGFVPQTQCPAPLTAYIIPNTGQVQTCQIGINTCPTNYQCTRSTSGTTICCGRSGIVVDVYGCPSGNAYLYPGTRTPLSCTRAGPPCPAGYSCQRSTRANVYQCCSNGPRYRDPESQSASGQRQSCRTSFECRDRSGAMRLCYQGFCMQ